MRPPGRLALAALAMAAAACGSPAKVGSGQTPETPSVATTGLPPTTTAELCGFRADTIKSTIKTVKLEVPGTDQALPLNLDSTQPLACGSVRANQGGSADLTFKNSSNAQVASCQFSQDPSAPDQNADAVMRTREPDGALLHIDNGRVTCTTTGKPLIKLCGSGDVQPDGSTAQFGATCGANHAMLRTYAGHLNIKPVTGQAVTLSPDQQIDLRLGLPISSIVAPPQISPAEANVLASQAALFHFHFVPPITITTTTNRYRIFVPPLTRP